MSLRARIGFDVGGMKLEEALEFATAHDLHYLDIKCDSGPNRLDNWSEDRVEKALDICRRNDIRLTLHTESGVNVAEVSPFVSEAVDQYLRWYIELARRLDCHGVVVHGGFHFSSQIEARISASIERLKRAVEYAEKQGVVLLLENLNFEPDDAEVHYLAHTVEECRAYFDAISSPNLGWAFTVNHANLVREGIDGFLPNLESDPQRAIQFVRSTPGVASALVGMSSIAHVEENLYLAKVPTVSVETIRAMVDAS